MPNSIPVIRGIALLMGSCPLLFAWAEGLDEIKVTNPATDGPIIEIMAIDADGTNLRKVASVPNYPIINSPEVSPDGEWIAVDGWKHGETLTDAHILLIHLKTGIISDLGFGAMPTWSADGRWIAYSRYGVRGGPRGVWIGTVTQSHEHMIDPNGWAITWSPDGEKLVYVRGNDLIVYDIVAKTQQPVFGDGKSPYQSIKHNPEWSPDSRRVCFIGTRQDGTTEFATVSAEGFAPELEVCCSAREYNPDIGWSKDGRRLTIPHRPQGTTPGQLWVYDFDKKGEPVRFVGQSPDRHNGGNDWSPDGKTLYFVSVK